MAVTYGVIGVDVGGTNTDAVIVDTSSKEITILAQAKTATTYDVTTGVNAAIHLALIDSRIKTLKLAIKQVNIGTTHFINAVVEGNKLAKVSVIRLCGTSSKKVPPYSDFPDHLLDKVRGSVFLVGGGYQFDGSEITQINEGEIVKRLETIKKTDCKNIVISGIFSPVRQEQEVKVREIIRKHFPEASVTSSHEIGKIGLLERENAAILNECIKPLCHDTISGFRTALNNLGLKCPLFLTQNDGTIISEDKALRYPVLTFASGATNSMRGAAFLSGVKDAIVVDIGGTSTDVGILLKGFPREASSEVKVGGIRTNFRMPDVISIGLGGGSYVTSAKDEQTKVKIGPLSAGYRIKNEAYVFAESKDDIDERMLTATDIVVAAGIIKGVGKSENVCHLDKELVVKAMATLNDMTSACIDQMRFNDRDLPLILVGGGSILIDTNTKFNGVTEVLKPKHFDVANAVGAALSQVSATADRVIDLEKYIDINRMSERTETKLTEVVDEKERNNIKDSVRKDFLQSARKDAMKEILEHVKLEIITSGAVPDTLSVVEKDDIALSYVPGNITRIKIKMIGDLRASDYSDIDCVPESVFLSSPVIGSQDRKQTVTNTGTMIEESEKSLKIQEPTIDEATGEWLISEYDVECLSIGAGIMGCGGGGNPHVAKILALKALKEGKRMRVVSSNRYLKDADPFNDLVTVVAFMGAPIIMYEKLVSGNETTGALKCLQDLYRIGGYDGNDLKVTDGVNIINNEGISYIDNYSGDLTDLKGDTAIGMKKIVAIMSAEIGGMNCIEPLLVGAELDLPILDCDGMGRAFPELQMFAPFIYGCKPYPSTIADDKGRRAVVLNVDGPKHLENHFRDVVISMGCSGGVVLSHFNKDEITTKTVQHSLSHAWRLGDTILRARFDNRPPVEAMVKTENGKFLLYGKISDVHRETTGGFNKGKLILEGLDDFSGETLEIDFQNEFLLARDVSNGTKTVVACTPDLITLMDADTAQPIPTEEVRFGIRVSVVALRVAPLMSTAQALKFVGPQAFGYPEDVKYTPIGDFTGHESVPPM